MPPKKKLTQCEPVFLLTVHDMHLGSFMLTCLEQHTTYQADTHKLDLRQPHLSFHESSTISDHPSRQTTVQDKHIPVTLNLCSNKINVLLLFKRVFKVLLSKAEFPISPQDRCCRVKMDCA